MGFDPKEADMTVLEKEFEFYLANQDEMVAKYDGFVVAIKGEIVLGAYRTYGEALVETVKDYEEGTFLLQKVSQGNKDYTYYYHSPRLSF